MEERHDNETSGALTRHEKQIKENQERHENEMHGAQNRHEAAIRRLQAECKDHETKANAKLTRTLDEHADEMRKIRQEIKISDEEHSLMIDSMRRQFDETLKTMNKDFNSQFRTQDHQATTNVQERITTYNTYDTTKTNEIKNLIEEHLRNFTEQRFKMEQSRSSYELKIN